MSRCRTLVAAAEPGEEYIRQLLIRHLFWMLLKQVGCKYIQEADEAR